MFYTILLHADLYPYQNETVRAMLDREQMPEGLNSLLWEEHRPSQDAFFYNRTAGEILDSRPQVNTGGFLCEEMVRIVPTSLFGTSSFRIESGDLKRAWVEKGRFIHWE